MTELVRKTIGQWLDETAERFADREALVYPELGLRLTYRQFRERVREAAKGLLRLGIEKGEHIAVWAPNVPEWVILQFASATIGAVLVTVNTNYRTSELGYLLEQSDSVALFLTNGFKRSDYVAMLEELCPELAADAQPPEGVAGGAVRCRRLPKLRHVVLLDEPRRPGYLHWSDVVALGADVSDAELEARAAQLSPDDVINMQYTSGTTGFPKGVMLTHVNIVNNGRLVVAQMRLTHEDRLCIPVPFFHCFGCVMGTLGCVSVGATMVPLITFDAQKVLEAVEKERCTALYGVPTMFIAELAHPDFDRYDLSSLRTGIMAGSPCPIEVMRQVVERMGCREITIAYGQTESSPVITQTSVDDPLERRVTTVGRPLPHTEVKIVDPQTGQTLPPGVPGELCTRGYHVMKGYYKMPEQTAQAIDAEGWLHTGDIAVMDEEGYVNITGRLKDMIIRGGENIYPREIEEFLYTNPKILDVQVVGVPDLTYGEQVMAFIRLKPGETMTEDEVRAYCEGKIAHYKIPKYIKFVDEYPMTASGKVQKYKLREMAIRELGLEAASDIETA